MFQKLRWGHVPKPVPWNVPGPRSYHLLFECNGAKDTLLAAKDSKQVGQLMPYLCYDEQVRKAARLLKVVDDSTEVSCAMGRGVIREEVWQDSNGSVAKYNLAFINHFMCSVDHGRVLGYDNKHGKHHRHFLGEETTFSFESYEKLLRRFLAEVKKLRKRTYV